MKIAIIGFSPSSYNDAPWDDDTWEKWGMPWDAKNVSKYKRLFEMHSPVLWDCRLADPMIEFWDGEKFHRKTHRADNYYLADANNPSVLITAANNKKVKLYVQDGIPEDEVVSNIGLITYPFERVIDCVKADYFQSSVAYALALAITEIYDRYGCNSNKGSIALYGIDVSSDQEWAYQRACIEYLVGIARGYGIDVYIPDSSDLCKFQDQTIKFGALNIVHTKRYGIVKSPQTFERWTVGERYTLDQLIDMDLPTNLIKELKEFNEQRNT